MDIKTWSQERTKELYLASKYWKPIIRNSFIASLSWWGAALGLGFLATLIALAITFKKSGEVEMNNFFPPNFWWGVLIIFGLLFLYQVFIEVAKKIDDYRIKADKYTWNDVVITSNDSPDEPILRAYLKVVNNKPYDIENVTAKLVTLTQNKFVKVDVDLPKNFWWGLEGQHNIHWTGKTLHKNGEKPRYIMIGIAASEQKAAIPMGNINEESINDQYFIMLDKDSTYGISIELTGEIDGHRVDTYQNSYSIQFTGDRFYLKERQKEVKSPAN